MNTLKSHNAGFSLIEVLIVIVIVAVLAGVALPSYNDSVTRSKRSDGKQALVDVASKMESYFFTNKTYTTDLSAIGASTSSPEGIYTLSVTTATSACPITTCYALVATATGSQASDGNLGLNSVGQKTPTDKW